MAANTTGTPGFDEMHDIVVSDPVLWWPLAPGWYVLVFAVLLVLLWLAMKALGRWRRNRYRRAALRMLDGISPRELPELVKRVSLSVWPRERVASLSGDEWLQFLDQSGNTREFSQGAGRLLLELSYNPNLKIQDDDSDYQRLLTAVQSWIISADRSNRTHTTY